MKKMLGNQTMLRFASTVLLAGAIAAAVGGCLLVPFPVPDGGGHHHHGYHHW